MRQLAVLPLLLIVAAVSVFAISNAQESSSTPPETPSADAKNLKIVPLVVLKPGETKELLMSTWCTVGITRSGGFGLTEMRDGKPSGGGYGTKRYEQAGVTISVPEFKEAETFAASGEFAALQKLNLEAFKITVKASQDAKPGLLEMHLVDATCSGFCRTDFRVLVVEQ